jgi:SAM-dependent methyltransferase
MTKSKTENFGKEARQQASEVLTSVAQTPTSPSSTEGGSTSRPLMASETSKYLQFTTKYCVGNGVDIGSGGAPVVPSAIQVELPLDQYIKYRSGDVYGAPIQWHGSAEQLPFKDKTLDYVYSSHLLEDFLHWKPVLIEWVRVLKKGGHLVILVPDKKLWEAALKRGQPPNCAHQHESYVGEISTRYAKFLGLKVIEDRLTALTPQDYSILFVGQRI